MSTKVEKNYFPYYDYIPQQGLANLKNYKYSGVDLSFIANNFLQPFWRWLAEKLPDWPAPNLITLTGFVPCLISYFVIAYYCPTLTEQAPRWVYLLNFLCLFFYQTMDALDGKQARRTGTSSPLGELFDHGCDALTTVFVELAVGATIQCGNGLALYTVILSMLIPFFTTQWEEYFTGTLVLGYIGVTEAQMVALSIHLSAFVFGPEIFMADIPVFGLNFTLSTWLVISCIISGIGQTFWNASVVFNLVSKGKAKMSNAIGYLIPIFLLVIISAFWYFINPTMVPENPHTFNLMIGLVVANFVGRIIVYRVCGLDASLFLELLVPLTLGTLNTLIFGESIISTTTSVWICLFLYFALYMHFALSIINQMTTYLGIRCLTIPVPNPATPKSEDKKKFK